MDEVEFATPHAGAAGSRYKEERAVKQPMVIELNGARPSAARQCGLRTGAAALRYAAGRPLVGIIIRPAARCFARLLRTNELCALEKKKRNALQPIDQPPTAEHIHVGAVSRRQLSHKANNYTSFEPRSSLMRPSVSIAGDRASYLWGLVFDAHTYMTLPRWGPGVQASRRAIVAFASFVQLLDSAFVASREVFVSHED
eukprot:scaffold134592_cov38-Prasinocladus_malaysianus.AAC.1